MGNVFEPAYAGGLEGYEVQREVLEGAVFVVRGDGGGNGEGAHASTHAGVAEFEVEGFDVIPGVFEAGDEVVFDDVADEGFAGVPELDMEDFEGVEVDGGG